MKLRITKSILVALLWLVIPLFLIDDSRITRHIGGALATFGLGGWFGWAPPVVGFFIGVDTAANIFAAVQQVGGITKDLLVIIYGALCGFFAYIGSSILFGRFFFLRKIYQEAEKDRISRKITDVILSSLLFYIIMFVMREACLVMELKAGIELTQEKQTALGIELIGDGVFALLLRAYMVFIQSNRKPKVVLPV